MISLFCLDVGASQLIVDGKIKLKNDSLISHFEEDGIVFENGSKLPADVVIYATGLVSRHSSFSLFSSFINRFGSQKALAEDLLGKEVADEIQPVWGLNSEGEINTAWRSSGLQGVYFMVGNLAMVRYFSRHLALCK